ncbi:hypothetical protein [Azospirillum aestuarii]|uniref:hypothetical protein n=1 Tax=Azospirillum aestuarii TaxID=2802052 RepID=UPI004054C159
MTDKTLLNAAMDVTSHSAAWINLMREHVASLPEDIPPAPECDGVFGKSFAQHELAAMERDLPALEAAIAAFRRVDVQEATPSDLPPGLVLVATPYRANDPWMLIEMTGPARAKVITGGYIETEAIGVEHAHRFRGTTPSATPTSSPSDDPAFLRKEMIGLQNLLKAIYDAPTMEGGYHILRDWARQFWPADPVGLSGAATAPTDLTGRAKIIAWAHWMQLHPNDVSGDPDELWTAIGPKNQSAYLNAARSVTSAPTQPAPLPVGYIPLPNGLHPDTADLVCDFAVAMAEKLRASEVKYGWDTNWKRLNWRDELTAELLRHVHKGDPRDVAAYCAFAWHHGWNVAPAAAKAQGMGWSKALEDIRAAGWAVAVHNDYRLHGQPNTFWLFTKGDRAVKGEGLTDAEALDEVRRSTGLLSAAPTPTAQGMGWSGTLGSISASEEPGGPLTVTLTMDTPAPKWVTFQAVWDALRVEVRPLTSAGEA